jgi:hypothetical protein
MDSLTSGQVDALRDLARKKQGLCVPYINIADARSLTDLGLARRSRQGWDITPAGLEELSGRPDPSARIEPF